MPSPFKPKEVTPVQKLAYYWVHVDDTTKGYFEQLYKQHPQDVSELLAGEALLPAGECKTLQDWVDGKGGGEALSAFDFSHVYISITDVRCEPEQVDSGGRFKIVWAGEAEADFPAREDRLVIMDRDTSGEVRTITLTYPEIKAGSVKEEIDCDPLPDGTYLVNLTVNTDGTDHGTELTAQGIRNTAGVDVYVGESEAAWHARLAPIIAQIQNKANEAVWVGVDETIEPRNAQAIAELTRLAVDIDRPGRVEQGPRTEVSTGLDSYAERLSVREPPYQLVDPAKWTTLRERLQGLTIMINADQIRTFQERLKAWLDDYMKDVFL